MVEMIVEDSIEVGYGLLIQRSVYRGDTRRQFSCLTNTPSSCRRFDSTIHHGAGPRDV